MSKPRPRKLLSGADQDRDRDIQGKSHDLSAPLVPMQQHTQFSKCDLVQLFDLQFNRSHEFIATILKQVFAPGRVRSNPLLMANDNASDGSARVAAFSKIENEALLVVSQAFEIERAPDLLLAAEMVIDAPGADSRPVSDIVQCRFGESLFGEAFQCRLQNRPSS